MAKTMLITGASKGIGAKFVEEFKDDYNIISVARTGNMTENGDVTDREFRKYLIEKYTPNVFINNVGGYSNSMSESMELNLIQAGELLEGFHNKMLMGHIINIGSYGRLITGYTAMGPAKQHYYAAKKAFNDWIRYVQINKEKPTVKISTITPQIVESELTPPDNGIENAILYANKKLIKPEYIAQTARYILNQPKDLVIEEIIIANK